MRHGRKLRLNNGGFERYEMTYFRPSSLFDIPARCLCHLTGLNARFRARFSRFSLKMVFHSILYTILRFIWWIVSSYITIRILRALWVLLTSLWAHFIARPLDLTLYQDSWTVVTDANDDLGQAYVEELAKTRGVRKFYLMGRNPIKLAEFESELVKRYQCDVKMRVFDFERDDLEEIPEDVKMLDVGILLNSVDATPEMNGRFMEQTDGTGSKLVKANVSGAIKMIEFILPGMVERNKGIIVNISSALGKVDF